jgi:hypothetical protein
MDDRTLTKRLREEVIQWLFKKSLSSVPIAAVNSSSAPKNRSSSIPGAIPMSPSAAHRAARPGSKSAMELVEPVITSGARCSLLYVPSAEKTLKFPSNREGISRYIAAIATGKSE